jgi:hypothetical protein
VAAMMGVKMMKKMSLRTLVYSGLMHLAIDGVIVA